MNTAEFISSEQMIPTGDSDVTSVPIRGENDFDLAQRQLDKTNFSEQERRNTIGHSQADKDVAPRLDVRETVLQGFRGVVVAVDLEEREFEARLTDMTDPEEEEFATFLMDEEPEQDLILLEVGAQFYWHIGFSEGKHEPRTNFSKIRFRRFPVWQRSDLDRARRRASQLLDGIVTEPAPDQVVFRTEIHY